MSRECEATEKNREEFRILKVRVRQARTPNFRFFEGGEMVGAPSFGTYGQLTGTRSGPTYLHTEHTEMYTATNSRALLHHAQVLKLCENILIFARRVWEATGSCYRCATQTRARRS